MTNYSYQVQRSIYAVDGGVINIGRKNTLNASVAAFAINTSQASINASLILTQQAATEYVIDANDVTLNRFITLIATGDSNARFVLTGAALTFTGDQRLTASPASYALTGGNLNFDKAYLLSQANDATNDFSITGQTLVFGRSYVLNPSTGEFAITGQAATLRIKNGRLVAVRAFFGITGSPLRTEYDPYITLPAVKPTQREFIPPLNSFNLSRSIDGVTYRRMNTSIAAGAELRLQYDTITDQEALNFLTIYDAVYGRYKSLDLPPEALAGAETVLRNYILQNGVRWVFAQPPTVESVMVGLHNISIVLKARIAPRTQFSLVGGMPSPLPDADGDTGTATGTIGGGGYGIFYPRPDPPTPPPDAPLCDGFAYVRVQWRTKYVDDFYWCGDCQGGYLYSDTRSDTYQYIITTPDGYANAVYNEEYKTWTVPPEYRLNGELYQFHKDDIRWIANGEAVAYQPNGTFFCPPNGPGGGGCYGQTYIGALYISSYQEFSEHQVTCGNSKEELRYPAVGVPIASLENNPEFATLTNLGGTLTGQYPTKSNTCANAQNATVTITEREYVAYFSDCGRELAPASIIASGVPSVLNFPNVQWIKPAWRTGSCGVNMLGVEYVNCAGGYQPGIVQFLIFATTTYGYQSADFSINISTVPAT